MKIAMVNTMYAPDLYGGAERVVQRLAEGLVAVGHDVVVVAAGPGRSPSRREVDGVRVSEVGLFNLFWPYGPKGAPRLLEPAWHALDLWNPVMVRRAGRVLHREQPDVVHTHGLVGFSTHLWPRIAQLGLPIVHTLHDYRLECVHAGRFKRSRACETRCFSCRLVGSMKRGPASEVDVVVGVSRHVLDSHVAAGFFEGSKKEVIPVPIDAPTARPRRVDRSSLVRLGYLGRIHPGKGLELLLASTLGLPESGWELLIAGGGEARFVAQLEGLPRHRNVAFVGPVDSSRFLAELDGLIVPSQWFEAAGLVVPEAYAHGTPVIATDRGGLPELVSDGRTGFLFGAGEPGRLATAIERCVKDPDMLRNLRDACLERANAHRIGRVVGQYVRCYADALSNS